MSIESVMPSSHLMLCHLLLLPPIPPSIRDFSNESTLCMRWPKYWSFSFSISQEIRNIRHSFFTVFSKMTRLPDILFYKTFGMLKLLKRSSLGKSTEWHPDYGDQEGLYLKTDKEVSHPFKHFAPHLLWVQIWCINRSNSIWWPIKNILGTSYAIAWAQEYKWSSLFEDSVFANSPTCWNLFVIIYL